MKLVRVNIPAKTTKTTPIEPTITLVNTKATIIEAIINLIILSTLPMFFYNTPNILDNFLSKLRCFHDTFLL
jgi:hypothetical protein